MELEVEHDRTNVFDAFAPAGNSAIGNKKISFEVSKQALETMLEGFHKVRDQLQSMG